MLNVQEVKNLESRWKKHKNRQYLKYFAFFAFFLILIVVTIFLFKSDNVDGILKYFKQNNQASIKSNKVAKKIINNEIKNNSTSSKITVKNKNKSKQADKIVKKAHIVKKEITFDENISKSIGVTNKNIPKRNDNDKLLVLNTNFLNNIYVKDSNNTNKTKSYEQLQNKTHKKIFKNKKIIKILKKQVPIEQKIFISSKKIDKIVYLRDKYYSSGKARYAILLSKEYYNRHKYKKSLKWAIISNNIDSSNEDSWILFAKNKVKLGKKNDAIKALRAYLKSYNSKRVKILLANIRNGVLK